MPWLIKLIMFICVVPTALLMFFIAFPANPEKRKMIFGVRDNPKFHEGDAAAKFKSIARSCRKSALIITIIVCVMSIVLLFLPDNGMTMLAWILLVYALFVVAVPFGKAIQSSRISRRNSASQSPASPTLTLRTLIRSTA